MRTPTAVLIAAPLLAAAVFAAAPARADDAAKPPEKVELLLSVKQGDVFHFRQAQHVEQAMKIGEMDITTTIATDQTMTYSVTAVGPDGQSDVKVTIGDIKGTFENSMLGTIEFDSTKPDDATEGNPMIATALKGLTMLANKSYQITLDKHGGVVKVTGMKEILETALKSNPMFAGKQMGGLLDDDGMKQQLQGQFAKFADGPVAVGAKWNVDSEIAAPVAMKVTTEYTLASADAAKAVVVSKSTFAAAAASPAAPGTEASSTVTVSRADGLMLKSETKTHTVMDMPMGGGKGGPEGQKMHMDMTMNVTVDRVTGAAVAPEPKKAAPEAPPPTPK